MYPVKIYSWSVDQMRECYKGDVPINVLFMVSWSNKKVFYKGNALNQDLFIVSWSNCKIFYKEMCPLNFIHDQLIKWEYFIKEMLPLQIFLWSVDQIRKYFISKCGHSRVIEGLLKKLESIL